jgi:hypothetical protein
MPLECSIKLAKLKKKRNPSTPSATEQSKMWAIWRGRGRGLGKLT